MAFVLEDGSGVTGANAYVAESFCTTHHADRGNTAWADYGTSEHQAGIIRASDYVDKRFGRRFRGERKLKEQGLEWPRLDAFDDDGFLLSSVDEVPRQLQRAVAEYALRAILYGVLAPDPLLSYPRQSLESGATERTTPTATGEVIRHRERVGPIEEEDWYEARASLSLAAGARSVQSSLLNDYNIPEYPEADMWIEELLRHSMTIRLARA